MSASGERFGDAIPSAWSCEQTYFRNHQALAAVTETLADVSVRPIRILQVGAGAIELMLLQAILDRLGYTGCVRVDSVDPSPRVAAIVDALQNGRSLSGPEGLTIYDAPSRRLSLAGLSRAFPSPEGTLNVHLSDPSKLRPAVAELSRLRLLPYWELTADAESAASEMLSSGLLVPTGALAAVTHHTTSFLDFAGPERAYHLIVGMFSLQYPIMDGHAAEVARLVERSLASGGHFLHAATYGAQARLLRACAAQGPALSGICGVREIDVVRYEGDSANEPARLRIRCDAVLARDGEAGGLFPERWMAALPWSSTAAASFGEVCRELNPDGGVGDPRLVAAFWGDARGARRFDVDRAELLGWSRPLPCRLGAAP